MPILEKSSTSSAVPPSDAQTRELAELVAIEKDIEVQLGSSMGVARLLRCVKERRLYLVTPHQTMSLYTEVRWHIKRKHMNRLILATKLVDSLLAKYPQDSAIAEAAKQIREERVWRGLRDYAARRGPNESKLEGIKAILNSVAQQGNLATLTGRSVHKVASILGVPRCVAGRPETTSSHRAYVAYAAESLLGIAAALDSRKLEPELAATMIRSWVVRAANTHRQTASTTPPIDARNPGSEASLTTA